jgi:hypothetical protein
MTEESILHLSLMKIQPLLGMKNKKEAYFSAESQRTKDLSLTISLRDIEVM